MKQWASLQKMGRILLAIALGWCALIEIVEIVAETVFHMRIDGDWFLLIAASSTTELAAFLRLYGLYLTLGIMALVVAWAVIVGMTIMAKRWVWWGWVLLSVVYVCLRLSALWMMWPPLYMAYDSFRAVYQYSDLIAAGEWNGDESVVSPAKAGARANLVVIIGESMTTDRMSLYGYSKPTTPCLDSLKDKMTVFKPVRPNYPDTVRSIRMMFTRATAAHPEKAIETAPVAFRKRGYRPVFIGGQPKWGRYCGVEHLVFAACETRNYVNERHATFDDQMIGYLQREMAVDSDQPFIIFLQLNGSHFPAENRTPSWFKAPDGFDAYDRSIAYTDSILGEMIKILPPNTTLVCVSDHGETPDSPNWRDAKNPSLWKVPVLIYPKNERVAPIETLDQIFGLLEELSYSPL